SLIIYPHAFHFFFNTTSTTEIYTLSLHDALPICIDRESERWRLRRQILPSIPPNSFKRKLRRHNPMDSTPAQPIRARSAHPTRTDRKSTRLNSSHVAISYAVFCLKKKTKKKKTEC